MPPPPRSTLFDLDAVFARFLAAERASYRRLAGLKLAGLERRTVKIGLAEDAAAAVYTDIAEEFRAVGFFAVKLPRRADLAGHDADYLRLVDAAVAERQRFAGSLVADAVAERAVNAGLGS